MNSIVSANPFRPELWTEMPDFDFTDITYHRARQVPAVRIGLDRPEVRNAFRPHTVDELLLALEHARQATDIGCVLITGNGPSPVDGGWAFCSGGDQRIRGRTGYRYAAGGCVHRRPGQSRPIAHSGGAAPHPFSTQGGDRAGQRLGCRWRA